MPAPEAVGTFLRPPCEIAEFALSSMFSLARVSLMRMNEACSLQVSLHQIEPCIYIPIMVCWSQQGDVLLCRSGACLKLCKCQVVGFPANVHIDPANTSPVWCIYFDLSAG